MTKLDLSIFRTNLLTHNHSLILVNSAFISDWRAIRQLDSCVYKISLSHLQKGGNQIVQSIY